MKNKTYARLSILSLALLAATANAQWIPSGEDGTKVGDNAVAKNTVDTAVGYGAQAYSDPFYEVDENGNPYLTPSFNTATGSYSSAIGTNNTATGSSAKAEGRNNTATGSQSSATGTASTSNGVGSSANGTGASSFGSFSRSEGVGSSAYGQSARATADMTLATGANSTASATGSSAVGPQARAEGEYSSANGNGAVTTGAYSVANGPSASASGQRSAAFGSGSSAFADDCVAMGSDSACSEQNTVSFGRDNVTTRRLTNVTAGTHDLDAANFGQVRQMSNVIGGGFGYDIGGTYYAPRWNFQDGSSHTDITSAFENLDGRLNTVENNSGTGGKDGASAYEVAQNNGYAGSETDWLASLKGEKGDRGEAGPAGADSTVPGPAGQDGRDGADSTVPGPTGPAGQDGKDSTVPGPAGQDGKDGVGSGLDEMAVRYTNASKTTAELAGAGGTRVSNVSNGRIAQGSTDAVNGGQVWQLQQDLNDRWNTTNQRIDRLEGRMNDRMNAIGAKTAAISQVNVGGSYLEVGEGEFGMSPGFSSNKAALAAGYRFRTSEKWSFSGAISVGGGSPAMGAIGVHYKFSR